MDFFDRIGKMAIGSRLRQLSERTTEDAAQVYKLYGVDMQPKWFPVFYVLSQGEEKAITAIADEIGHSHPSVSKIVREMSRKGILVEKKDKADGRRNVVTLSKKGKEIPKKIKDQYTDVSVAIEEMLLQTKHDLWKALGEWEFLLNQKGLFRRVLEQKKKRESQKVQIVNYRPIYKKAFKELNEEWITTYFKLEASDRKALDNPQGYILEKGGHILVALLNDVPVGVCALIKMNDGLYDFELAKMAVSQKERGKNIGWMLGQAIIEKAISLGAAKIYLESNTMLEPAIKLYQKLGFKKIAGHPTPYERCNIQMELNFE
jgi:DNA-binding MarR family transcriptional regulator/predicted GNAT family N-acyltransferase